MKICSHCGAVVSDAAKFCKDCGSPLPEVGEDSTELMMDPEDVTVIIPESEEPAANADPAVNEDYADQYGGWEAEQPYQDPYMSGQQDQEQAYQDTPQYGVQQYQSSQQQYQGSQYQNNQYQNNEHQYQYQNNQQQYQSAAQGNPQAGYGKATPDWDHTSEFDPKDISDNKVIAMLVYLMGWIGIIIALLAGNQSPYAAFHVRQGLKFVALDALMVIASLLLCWTIIVPIAAAVLYVILFVVKIICFFSICKGNAKEPPIVRAFGFLK